MKQQGHKGSDVRMVPFRVFVAGAPCDIAVYSRAKTGSTAVGQYAGQQIEVEGVDAISAAEAWARAARHASP